VDGGRVAPPPAHQHGRIGNGLDGGGSRTPYRCVRVFCACFASRPDLRIYISRHEPTAPISWVCSEGYMQIATDGLLYYVMSRMHLAGVYLTRLFFLPYLNKKREHVLFPLYPSKHRLGLIMEHLNKFNTCSIAREEFQQLKTGEKESVSIFCSVLFILTLNIYIYVNKKHARIDRDM
jgi:hypothetical protein